MPRGVYPRRQAQPARIIITQHHSYYTDDGLYRAWALGSVETDPALIAELIGRRAPYALPEE